MQCHETKAGLIVSAGYGAYMPSSSVHMIYEDININADTQQITVTDKEGLRAIIREATIEEPRSHEAYIGENNLEDQERFKRHTRLIEIDAKHFNLEQSL